MSCCVNKGTSKTTFLQALQTPVGPWYLWHSELRAWSWLELLPLRGHLRLLEPQEVSGLYRGTRLCCSLS